MLLKKQVILDQPKTIFLKGIVLFLLFFQGIPSMQAQQSNILTLNEAIRIAKENNRTIKKSHILKKISESGIKEAKNLRLPEVQFNAMYSRLSDVTLWEGGGFKQQVVAAPKPGNTIFDAVTKFDMPLYEGSKIKNEIKKSKQEDEIAELKVEKTENDVQLDVTATFLGIYKMMELQKIIEESIKEEQERLKEVKAFKTFGIVTKNEVLRAELQLYDHELGLLTNKKNIAIALQDLKTMLQLPEEEAIALDTAGLIEMMPTLKDYSFYFKETMQNEEMRIVSKEIDIKKTELKMVKANALPRIALFGNYSLNYPMYLTFSIDMPFMYTVGQVGIEASYNISNLYKNKSRVQIANLKVDLQKNESEIVKNEMTDKVFKNHTQYQEIQDKLKVTDKALGLAKENYRIVKAKYLNQLVLITEMVDADNALLQAKFNQISTKIDAVMKHYELLHTAGILNK